MLNLESIRNDPEHARKALHAKQDSSDLDRLLAIDRNRRSCQQALDALRHDQKRAGDAIAQAKKNGQDAAPIMERMRDVSEKRRHLENTFRDLTAQLNDILLTFPNMPLSDVPVGADARHNETVREWGEKKTLAFDAKPHWELATTLGILDPEKAAKLAGSGFTLFLGAGARLERALINFMLDLHTDQHGYREVAPPVINKRRAMTGTGQLPKLEEDMYRIERDDLFLIPTAEVPLTNIHAEEILDPDVLPCSYAAFTPCFRREAGAYGKETRGFIRVHQFAKVEMVKLVYPETSQQEHESLVQDAEAVLQALGLHYRVVQLCTGDLSFAAAKCYDLEVWAPGVAKYLEISSCSNFLDFQARRCNIRFRRTRGAKPEFVHTLNGSGVALPRAVVAILENYQHEDGSIDIPEVLWPYMGGIKRLEIP